MFFFFSPRVLRVPSTDRPETLPPDRNLRVFYNASPKIRGPSPKKLYPLKNFGRFWTTSDFDREYLRNGFRYLKSAGVTMAIPPAFNEKRPVNFGPLTAWNYMWVRTHYNAILLGDYISAHRGCCAPKILHALEIGQGLIAHTRSGTGVPPKNSNRENVKFGIKFRACTPITSGPVGVSSQNIFHTTCHGTGLKFGRAKKTSKIQRHFWQLSTLIANISGMTPYIQNLKEMWSTAIPPAFQKKSGELWSSKKKVYWLKLSHPSGLFWGNYISAHRGCCALKFIHALEIAQTLIAHT